LIVLGLAGSLRRGSLNRRLLRAAAFELPPGASLEPWDGLTALPLYDEDLDREPAPAAVAALRERLAAAPALLIATPEYNGSIPGPLKNAIDWASRPYPGNCLRGKPVAVVGASSGPFGAIWAQAELRKVLGLAGARVVDGKLPVGLAAHAFDERGRLRDPRLRSALGALAGSLVEAAAQSGSAPFARRAA
jgi:chromate reductase, NAD(P)H dehydrogenase (quinone)